MVVRNLSNEILEPVTIRGCDFVAIGELGKQSVIWSKNVIQTKRMNRTDLRIIIHYGTAEVVQS